MALQRRWECVSTSLCSLPLYYCICKFSSIVLLHLRVLFYCTIASASSLLLYYSICKFSSIVLLHLRVLFYCTIASASSLLLSYCIDQFSSIVLLHPCVLLYFPSALAQCTIAHIPTAHCFPLHCSTIWMCWSPLCLSAQITIISEYTQYM